MGERFFDRAIGIGAGVLGAVLLGAAVVHLGAPVPGAGASSSVRSLSAIAPVAVVPMAPAAVAIAVAVPAMHTRRPASPVKALAAEPVAAKRVEPKQTVAIHIVPAASAPIRPVFALAPRKREPAAHASVHRVAPVLAAVRASLHARKRFSRPQIRNAIAAYPVAVVVAKAPAKARRGHAPALPEPPVGYNPNPTLVFTNAANVVAPIPVVATDATAPPLSLSKHTR